MRECLYEKKENTKKVKLEKALNKQEKKLLKSAIKPFRDKVKTLSRIEIGSLGHAIHIRFNGCDENGYDGTIIFIGSEVYKGMELNKEYTLKELCL